MADEWYYAKGGNRIGPASTERLRQLAGSGQVQPTDLVWKSGMAGWAAGRQSTGPTSDHRGKPLGTPGAPVRQNDGSTPEVGADT
jgi:hypothetical protein